MISFKSRFIQEETEQQISEKVNTFNQQQLNSYKPASRGISQAAQVSTISPQQSIIRASEAEDDLNRSSTGNIKPNPTADDADKMARVTQRANLNATTNNSRTSAGAITEATEEPEKLPGPFNNPLTEKLNNLGVNTGFSKPDLDPKGEATKTGQKNINTGTKASFGLGRSDAKRQANDSLNTAQNVPKASDINNATSLMDSYAIRAISKLVEEYTNIDEKWGKHAPGITKPKPSDFKGVQPGTHTKETGAMVQSMNGVTDDKNRVQSKNRAATMPKYNDDPAGKKTGGINMQRSSIVHSADDANAKVRAEREQRMQEQSKQEGQ